VLVGWFGHVLASKTRGAAWWMVKEVVTRIVPSTICDVDERGVGEFRGTVGALS
jgi:hypothetical protein